MNTEQTQATEPVDTSSTDTTTDAPADLSIADEVGAHFELAEKGEESTDLSAAARTLAKARKSAAKPTDAVTSTTTAAADTTTTASTTADPVKAAADAKAKADAAAPVEAPAHWPTAAREMFAKQPPEVKAWLLDRHKAMESDYTKKTQELAPNRRFVEDMDDVFKPYDEEIRQHGTNRAAVIRQWAGDYARWRKDPGEYLRYVAQHSGIDLKTFANGAPADPASESPMVRELKNQVATLTGKLDKQIGAQNDQQQNARLNEVTQFADEKDAQGQLKRPYFDEVAKDVAAQIHASKDGSGKPTISLQDAYDRAIYANPTTRAKVLTAQDAERRTKEEAERKAKADAAKKAGFDVKGEGAATAVAATTGTVGEDLRAAFAAVEGRV